MHSSYGAWLAAAGYAYVQQQNLPALLILLNPGCRLNSTSSRQPPWHNSAALPHANVGCPGH